MEATAANTKMKVEIWSDIMCPFCYIGKRHFEKAMEQFSGNEDIDLVWKSFQLDPSIPENNDEQMSVSDYLAQRKGISVAQVAQMQTQVTQMASNAGLEYHLDKTIVANSFKAHRLIQLAKEKGLGDKAEEVFFYANFTNAQDFGDTAVLHEIGKEIGLTEADVTEALTNNKYAQAVKHDISEAQQIGVGGVPFFVFNRKYAVSGAQPAQSFLEILEKSHTEWRNDNPKINLQISEGPSCSPDGDCS